MIPIVTLVDVAAVRVSSCVISKIELQVLSREKELLTQLYYVLWYGGVACGTGPVADRRGVLSGSIFLLSVPH